MTGADDTTCIDELVSAARAPSSAMNRMALRSCLTGPVRLLPVLMEPARNEQLSKMAVAETGLGNVADKIRKNHNKTLGLMRDPKNVQSFGHIGDDAAKGLSTYLRPKGVIAAIVPSTNPLATPVNNIINALKTGNAIIIAPSPKGVKPATVLLGYIHDALAKLGVPAELVQMVPAPPSKPKTQRLMQLADLVVVTGSQSNVRVVTMYQAHQQLAWGQVMWSPSLTRQLILTQRRQKSLRPRHLITPPPVPLKIRSLWLMLFMIR